MSSHLFKAAFILGALATLWVGYGFLGSHMLALCMTLAIALVYGFGAHELRRFRQNTMALSEALTQIPQGLQSLDHWLSQVPVALQNAVRLRVEGERVNLPGPAMTPYLAGLLVMLGMLGTFLGMVVTLNGAVFALEGTSNLQAIRTAFSEPIRGLGLAFGTSVAGVATSAMLGLMAAISRRERLAVTQVLDTEIATSLRTFSLSYQRNEAFKALQIQAQTLPQMVAELQAMTRQMQQGNEQLHAQLLARQAEFHSQVGTAYTELARGVDQSLRNSLTQSAATLGHSVRPVLEAAVVDMAQETRALHQAMVDTTQQQLSTLASQFSTSTEAMRSAWTGAIDHQQHSNTALLAGVDATLQSFGSSLEQRSQQLLASLQQAHAQLQQQLAQSEQERMQSWLAGLRSTADQLHLQWQQAAQDSQAQQALICHTLDQTAQHITAQAHSSASQTLAEISRLMAASEVLIQSRASAEARWTEQHTQRMDQVASTLQQQLLALRQEESQRGEAAVQRLTELQAAVTAHLQTLGTAMEEPITRLIHTASEAPRAAAEVIGQMRREHALGAERENTLLEERSRIMETLNTLLEAVNHASAQQRAAIDALVQSTATTLQTANDQFAAKVEGEASRMADIATHLSARAVDVASLGETFAFALHSFQQSSQQLTDTLQRLDAALEKSLARSDDQLAYYVAQAREVVDLSVLSQKAIFEELRQLQGKAARSAPGLEHA